MLSVESDPILEHKLLSLILPRVFSRVTKTIIKGNGFGMLSMESDQILKHKLLSLILSRVFARVTQLKLSDEAAHECITACEGSLTFWVS